MNQEKILESLSNLGLSKAEARIYFYLAKKGPKKGNEITKELKIKRQQLYLTLKTMQSRAIVTATLDRPSKFSAIPFDKLLDIFAKAKLEEAKIIQSNKGKLLSDWDSINLSNDDSAHAKFNIIKGRNYVYAKIQQMIKNTKHGISFITTISSLVRAYKLDAMDVIKLPKDKKINLKFLIELSHQDIPAIKEIIKSFSEQTNLEIRVPDLGQPLTNHIIVKDDDEAMFFITTQKDTNITEQERTSLWTNSKTLVQAFSTLFLELWSKSSDINNKIMEIETGKPVPKTCIIDDPEKAKKNYHEQLRSAKEIIMLTSAEDLKKYPNYIFLKEEPLKNQSIRIMAPITTENLDAVNQLSKHHSIRHVPTNYLKTTIIDSKHLYQFKNPISNIINLEKELSFESTFYSNDPEYVEKTKQMLESTWKNARTLSNYTVDEMIKPPIPKGVPIADNEYAISKKDGPYQKMFITINEEGDKVTSEYILNKIINARRVEPKNPQKDQLIKYGSIATAVVHSPNNLKLPDLMMTFYHCNKQSSFGAEDYFQIYLWLETPKGPMFVPVAVVGDNSKGVKWRKNSYYTGTPADKNCQLLKKDQLKFQAHGNTFFAGWAVPIPLKINNYILPPAGILLEGYSRLKTSVTNFTMPSGAKVQIEGNGFDAFVTLLHENSKYAGPGTDGTIGRDFIITTYPPKTID